MMSRIAKWFKLSSIEAGQAEREKRMQEYARRSEHAARVMQNAAATLVKHSDQLQRNAQAIIAMNNWPRDDQDGASSSHSLADP